MKYLFSPPLRAKRARCEAEGLITGSLRSQRGALYFFRSFSVLTQKILPMKLPLCWLPHYIYYYITIYSGLAVLPPTILPMKLPLKRLLQCFRLHTYVAELAPTILPMKLPLIRLLLYCIRSNSFAYEIAT